MCHHVPLLKNNGNPRHSPIITNANKKQSRPSYVLESYSPIAPLELKLLCDVCIDSNNVCEFQFWVMVLFGVHLFLRGDKIIDLGFFCLIEKNAICNNNGTIAGLLVHILGELKNKKNTSGEYDIMGYVHSSVVMSC